jgi:uncharacterized membrane protein
MAETEQLKEKAGDVADSVNGGGQNGGLKKALLPAAAGLGGLAVTFAARKATDAVKDRAKPKLEEEGSKEAAKIGGKAADRMKDSGPMGKVAGKALEKATGGGKSSGKTRRLPIQRWTDVAAPIDVVYERWTEFEDFPKFMHRVLSVKKEDRNKVSWEEKIWFSRRQWEGEITDRRKNERVAWKTTKGPSHSGVVTFHKLDSNLTRVMVDMDFVPGGMIEKMASGLRFVKRAVESDLARFKAYVELGEARGLNYRHDPDDKGSSSNGNNDKNEEQNDQENDDSNES